MTIYIYYSLIEIIKKKKKNNFIFFLYCKYHFSSYFFRAHMIKNHHANCFSRKRNPVQANICDT